MTTRRTASRIPLEQPLMTADEIESTWLKWLSTINDYVPAYARHDLDVTGLVSSVPANSTSEQTFTINGVASNDLISVNKPSHQAGLGIVNVRASAKNQIAITYMNTSAGAITPSNETYIVKVEKI